MPAAATSWGKILTCAALSLEARGLPAGIRAFSAAVAQEVICTGMMATAADFVDIALDTIALPPRA